MAQFLMYTQGLHEVAVKYYHCINRKVPEDFKNKSFEIDESRLNKSICERDYQLLEENIVDEIIFSDYGEGAVRFLEGHEDFDGFV